MTLISSLDIEDEICILVKSMAIEPRASVGTGNILSTFIPATLPKIPVSNNVLHSVPTTSAQDVVIQ